MNQFKTPLGTCSLKRYPIQKDEQLRAWDAADEYLLSFINENKLLEKSTRILIVNDNFGALTTSISGLNASKQHELTSISDSYLSQHALLDNIKHNQLNENNIRIQNTLHALDGVYDLVLIKVPKNLAMLEDELFRLRNHCNNKTRILAGGMTKHIHTSTLKLFERIIGPTKTTLAQKKSRLIISEFNSNLTTGDSPYPSNYFTDATGETYLNHANSFSREKLDIGSRFMLQHIPQSARYEHIADLACGNGILGIAAASRNPKAKVTFVDESFMAIESTKHNVKNILIEKRKSNTVLFDYKVTDCLQGIEIDSLDLILNNPPFHQQHVIGDFIAQQMFKEAKEKLKQRGELWIVGNRHLGYHVKLKRLFGNCETVAGNKKFVILKSQKK